MAATKSPMAAAVPPGRLQRIITGFSLNPWRSGRAAGEPPEATGDAQDENNKNGGSTALRDATNMANTNGKEPEEPPNIRRNRFASDHSSDEDSFQDKPSGYQWTTDGLLQISVAQAWSVSNARRMRSD